MVLNWSAHSGLHTPKDSARCWNAFCCCKKQSCGIISDENWARQCVVTSCGPLVSSDGLSVEYWKNVCVRENREGSHADTISAQGFIAPRYYLSQQDRKLGLFLHLEIVHMSWSKVEFSLDYFEKSCMGAIKVHQVACFTSGRARERGQGEGFKTDQGSERLLHDSWTVTLH